MNFHKKRLINFYVKYIFTNVQENGALRVVEKELYHIGEDDLPLSKGDYLILVIKCLKFGAFMFYGDKHRQHKVLAMS